MPGRRLQEICGSVSDGRPQVSSVSWQLTSGLEDRGISMPIVVDRPLKISRVRYVARLDPERGLQEQKRRPKAPLSIHKSGRVYSKMLLEATRGLNGESPWCGASTTTTVPGLTRL